MQCVCTSLVHIYMSRTVLNCMNSRTWQPNQQSPRCCSGTVVCVNGQCVRLEAEGVITPDTDDQSSRACALYAYGRQLSEDEVRSLVKQS